MNVVLDPSLDRDVAVLLMQMGHRIWDVSQKGLFLDNDAVRKVWSRGPAVHVNARLAVSTRACPWWLPGDGILTVHLPDSDARDLASHIDAVLRQDSNSVLGRVTLITPSRSRSWRLSSGENRDSCIGRDRSLQERLFGSPTRRFSRLPTRGSRSAP